MIDIWEYCGLIETISNDVCFFSTNTFYERVVSMPQGVRVCNEDFVRACFGTTTISEVATKTGLAPTTCYNRVKNLRNDGMDCLPSYPESFPKTMDIPELIGLWEQMEAEQKAATMKTRKKVKA